ANRTAHWRSANRTAHWRSSRPHGGLLKANTPVGAYHDPTGRLDKLVAAALRRPASAQLRHELALGVTSSPLIAASASGFNLRFEPAISRRLESLCETKQPRVSRFKRSAWL